MNPRNTRDAGKIVKSSWRFYFVIVVLLFGAGGLIWRIVDLNILERNFLLAQSNARTLRTVNIPAYRGMITDRFNQPLAISAQVDSIWINPQLFEAAYDQLQKLATLLKIQKEKITDKAQKNSGKEFIYLKRGVSPAITEQIKNLEIPGVYFQHDYHRFYPQSDVLAHVIGFTNIDDQGQEGLELEFDSWLRGVPGKKKVIKDRLGNIVAELDETKQPRQGHDLTLSLDSRVQYLAYEELKNAVENTKAQSASIIVLDSKSGEILAMANQPSFNPNHILSMKDGRYRNRAMTDMFEPGSTIKPFSIINALESGKYHYDSQIDTSPGWININGDIVRDEHNNGVMSLTRILEKSSDVGVAKIILSLPPNSLCSLLQRCGFGQRSASAFPGEASGSLLAHTKWYPIEQATLSFGYGISVTAIQLAQAYSILAAGGKFYPPSLIKLDKPPMGKQIIDKDIAKQMLLMLEAVVKNGTGALAKVSGYRVGGKTGTANMVGRNGYEKNHFVSSFVGIAPITDPRLVVVVVIKDPQGKHQGGEIAAPVFARVMAGSLRLLNVLPDDVPSESK